MSTSALLELAVRAGARPVPDQQSPGAASDDSGGMVPGRSALASLRDWAGRVQGRAAAPTPFRAVRMLAAGTLAAEMPVEQGGSAIPVQTLTGGADEALARAVAAVDAQVDSGADLILLVSVDGRPDLVAARALVSVVCRLEPAELVRYGDARDDPTWMSELATLRDARRRAAAARETPAHSIAALGHAPLISATGALLQAAARRTPVILEGSTVLAAALAADALAPGAAAWWRLSATVGDPLEVPARQRLSLTALLDLPGGAAPGAAGLLMLDIVQMAVRVGHLSCDPTISRTSGRASALDRSVADAKETP